MPHVIPIAEKNEISGARFYCSLKILCASDVALIDQNLHRKRRARSELLRDLDAAVCGGVVAHDQFVGESRLTDKAFELLADEPLAVVRRHRDGDFRSAACLLVSGKS